MKTGPVSREKSAGRARTPREATHSSAKSEISSALALQDAIGNRSTLRLLQRKLAVGPTGSALELEAEAFADWATAGSTSGIPPQLSPAETPASLHRNCTSCGGERTCTNCKEDDERLQRRAASGGEPSPLAVPNDWVRRLGSGQPLDRAAREFLESRLGTDLRDVRIHHGAAADESARGVRADAYTVGNDIVFGAGKYAPQSAPGRRLLAHEAAHVVQQRAAGGTANLQRQPAAPDSPPTASTTMPEAEFDPCAVEERSLTNEQLILTWTRVTDYTDSRKRGEGRFYDYANLGRRIAEERRRRARMGHVWLGANLRAMPDRLYDLQPVSGTTIAVYIANREQERGAPQSRTVSSVITPSQFDEFLERQNIRRISVEDFYERQRMTGEAERLEIILPAPPTPTPRPISRVEMLLSGGMAASPFFNPGGFGGQSTMSGGWDPFGYGTMFGGWAPSGFGGFSPLEFGGMSPLMPPLEYGGMSPLMPELAGEPAGAGGYAVPIVVGVSGSGLHASPFDLVSRGTVLRQVYTANTTMTDPRSVAGAELYWRGHLPEHALQTQSYADLARWQNLNRVAASFPVFDFATRGAPNTLVSVTHSLPDPATGVIDFSHYRTKVRIMAGNAEASKMTTAIANLSGYYGMALTVQDVNARNYLAVPDDQVAAVRANLADAIAGRSARPQSYANLLDALLRADPVMIRMTQYSSWNQVTADRSSGALPRSDYDTLRQTLGQRIGERIIGAGITTPEILAMVDLRIQAQGLGPRSFGALAAPEILDLTRTTARGIPLPQARAEVAHRSGQRGAKISAAFSGGAGLVSWATGERDLRGLARVGVDVGMAAAGGYSQAWLEARANTRLLQPLLSEASSLSATGASTRSLTAMGIAGRGLSSAGSASIVAPAITLGTMGIQDLFFGADYTYIDYAAKGARTAVSAGGGALAAGGAGAVAGSFIPIPGAGTIIGFLGGLAGYYLTDRLVGDDIEEGVRKGLGEYGCTSGVGPQSSRASDWRRPGTFSAPVFTCFTPETRVRMATGELQMIERLCTGDAILGCSANENIVCPCRVTHVFRHAPAPYLRLEFADGTTLSVTEAHPIATLDGWTAAGSLKPGDGVQSLDGDGRLGTRTLIAVHWRPAASPVYNLSVAGYHTYFAEDVLVHNKI